MLYFSIFDMYNKDNKKIYLNDAVSKEGDYALIFDKEGELVSLFIAEEFSDMPVPQQIKDICKHIFNIDVENIRKGGCIDN